MTVYLKVKIKSLAAEAKIISLEEQRYMKRILVRTTIDRITGQPHQKWKVVRNHPTRLSLRDHRKGVVREEARASLIAYGYLRGTPLASFDQLPWRAVGNKLVPIEGVDWKKVQAMVVRFGGQSALTGFDVWTMGDLKAAKAA